jgi:hypothetical protein
VVIVEGSILEVRDDLWIGPAGLSSLLVVRLAVEDELYGSVTSKVVDVAIHDDWPPKLKPGRRMMVIAGYQTFYLPTSAEASMFPTLPPYGDLMVPAVPGTIYIPGVRDGQLLMGGTRSNEGVPWVYTEGGELRTYADGVEVLRQLVLATGRLGDTISGVDVALLP